MQKFSFSHLDSLNFNDQKEYITKFFVPLTTGEHCLLENGVYVVKETATIKSVYFNRFGKKLSEFYFHEFNKIRTPVYKLNKPLLFDENVNLCPQLPTHKPYSDFDVIIKNKCKIFLDYMFDVLCNKRDDVMAHLCKWIANMCKGNKNDAALVLKTGAKGVGKSTLPVMLTNYIIGRKLGLQSSSRPLLSNFNSVLADKLLVYFEELETFSVSQWMGVDSVIKRLITSDVMLIEKKGIDSYEIDNINNYIFLTNHDLCDADRRMFVLDVQCKYLGKDDYWINLYNNCMNEEVGYALFCYFSEIDTTGFRPQSYPMTTSKLNSISKRLDIVYQFLKEEYILKNQDLKIKLSDFYENFTSWCIKHQKKACIKTDFVTKLSEIQVNHYKSNGYLSYNVKVDVLKSIADKQHWINELDEYKKRNDDEGIEELNPLETVVEPLETVETVERVEINDLINKNVKVKMLIESNQKITTMLTDLLNNLNIEKIKQEIEELPKPKVKNSKSNNKKIDSLIDSIELF